jgi:hypothetical protein
VIRSLIGLFLIVCLGAPLAARADSLHLQPFAPEAQFMLGLSTNYTINDAGTQGKLTSASSNMYIYYADDLNSFTPDYEIGTFNLSVYFKQDNGHFVADLDNPDNSLSVLLNGDSSTPVFLSKHLLAFGSDGSLSPQFEFLWTKDDGSSEVKNSPLPFIGVILLPLKSSATADFDSFDNPFGYTEGEADIFLTPTPTSAAGGVLLGLLSFGALIRRRHATFDHASHQH